VAFRYTDSVGTREQFSIAAQWLACTYPYRRFAGILANDSARLGADVVRYSFIAVDLHHLLLAGLRRTRVKTPPAQNFGGPYHPTKRTIVDPGRIWWVDISSEQCSSVFSHGLDPKEACADFYAFFLDCSRV
jgi:hypothetical protein